MESRIEINLREYGYIQKPPLPADSVLKHDEIYLKSEIKYSKLENQNNA